MTRRRCAWLLVLLPALAGCVHFTHKSPDECLVRPSQTVPDESKACVYVFLFDSYNPIGSGNLVGVRDHLHEIGFGKTYFGWPHHINHFLSELQTVSAERENARFAVIGSGHGAVAAQAFAAAAADMGIIVDAAIYIEPHGLGFWDGEDTAMATFVLVADDLESHACPHVSKSAVAMHPSTLETIEQELTLMAMTVPPPARKKPMRVDLVPPLPAPRETKPIPKELPPDWQFLRPRHPWDPAPPAPRYGDETLPYPRTLPELPPPREVK